MFEVLAARTWSAAVSLRVTVTYAVALGVVSYTLTKLGPHERDVVISKMSTNLHNLAHGHLVALVGSAFVTDGGAIGIWLPGLVCLLALGELIWRSGGLLIAFTTGHIGATLIVAAGLAAGLHAGLLPISIAHATDVGISYGAVAVLGALTASIPSPWRPIWIGWWLGTSGAVAVGADFTAFGHLSALLLGMALSPRLRRIERWTPARMTLLAGGSAFGCLLVSGLSAVPVATGLALALVFSATRYLYLSGRRDLEADVHLVDAAAQDRARIEPPGVVPIPLESS